MPHRDPHHRSDPETTFDTWLDALVAGTPAHVASQDDPSGPLARARAGARQLHGLAAQAAMPGTAVHQRIREDLMQSGALAAGGGRRWKPERRRERQVPWWSPTSPVLATALAIAVVVALVASLVWMQRPVSSPGTSDAPGFAVASPEASPSATTTVSDLLVLEGATEEEAKSLADHVALIDEDGLTINQPNGDTIELPGVISVETNTVPGQALVTRSDDSRAVIDLATGDTLFDLPSVTEHQRWAGPYLFVSESEDNAGWMVHDTRTGDSRALSEIVELPEEPAAFPSLFGLYSEVDDAVLVHFLTSEHEVSPLSDVPSLVIAGSLDRATTLDGYPPASQVRSHLPVISDDGSRVAWISYSEGTNDDAVVVVNTASGEELARFEMGATHLAGFLDNDSIVVGIGASIRLLSWDSGNPEQRTLADGLGRVTSPLLHAPTQNIYFSVDSTEGWRLDRLSLPDGSISTVTDLQLSSLIRFTTPNGPWIIADLGRNTTLVDARTGEVVSQLSDVPKNASEFNNLVTSVSRDGSTVLQMIPTVEGQGTYVVSPRFPDGLTLTAPIDEAEIAASESPDGIPVNYRLSADGKHVMAGTHTASGFEPQLIGTVAEDPGWTELSEDIESLSWLPMPAEDESPSEPQRLPAQDFATPFATPASEELSCSAPGYRPAIRSEVDPENLAMIGGEPIRFNGETTITAANGTEITFDEETVWTVYPRNDRVLVSGESQEEMHTVTSLVTGESWTFPETEDAGFPSANGYVFYGQWLIGPTDESATDLRIINTATGAQRLTSDIFGTPFDEAHMPTIRGPQLDPDAVALIFSFIPARDDSSGTAPSVVVLPDDDPANAYALPDEHREAEAFSVITDDGSRIAYFSIEGTVRVLDGSTGELLSEHPGPDSPASQTVVGLTSDDQKLIVRSNQEVWTIDLVSGELATVLTTDGVIHQGNFDPTTGTSLLSINHGEETRHVWLDPGTGEVKDLDIDGLADMPHAQFGWAMIQTSDEDNVDYAMLDMATGELAMEPVVTDRQADPGGTWIVGDSPDTAGIYVIRTEPGTMLVLDGPGGRAFELTTPVEESRTAGVAIGVSPNRECIVYTQPGSGDVPGASWVAPLEPDAGWTELPFELSGWLEMPTPQSESQSQPLPALNVTTPEATPDASALEQLIPDGMVPVMSPEPWDIFDRSEAGGIGESGLTIPLGNGETYRLPDGRRVTQISPTSIVLVERHDGTRLTIDLDTGETLAELPERSDEERIIGLYRFAPVDEEQTAWTITDLRDGTETDTTVIGDGPFNDAVQVVPMLYSLDALDRLVIQFVTETSVGDTIPWQGLSTDEGPVSGTLVIPGSLDDARFLDTMAGRIDPFTPAVAISTGDPPLLAYARTGDSDAAIVLEDAVTGEEIATWSARDLQQRTSSISFAGFSDDGQSLIAWVGEGGYGPDFVHRLTWDGGADIADSIELPFEEGSIDLVIGTGPSVLVLTSDGSSQPQRWKLTSLDSGKWQDLPHLDGYQPYFVDNDSPWVVMGSPDGTADQPVIVDRRTGEIAASTEYPQSAMASSDRRSLDLSVVVLTSFDGSGGTTGYVLDAERGEAWEVTPPKLDGMTAPNVTYDVSPDGSILVAKSQEAAPDGVVETWISPVQPEPERVSVGQRTITAWLVYPDD